MSAANLSAAPPQQRALSAQGYRQHSRAASSPGPRSASHPHPTAQSYATRQQAKSPIAQHAGVVGVPNATLSPDDKQNGEDSQLGYPSEQLKMADFELMKTLGTGTKTRAARSFDTVPDLTFLYCRNIRPSLAMSLPPPAPRISGESIRFEGTQEGRCDQIETGRARPK